MLFMAQEKMAPKFLGKTNSRGVPVYAIVFTNLIGAISMMNISTGGGQAYSYIVNLSGVSTFLVWGSISFTHIRFRKAWKAQGRTPGMLPFKSLAYPWNAYFGLCANIFLALVQGWTTLSPFDAGLFVDAYIMLPVFFIVYVGYKFWFKTRFWRSEEINLDAGMRKDLDLKDEYLNGDPDTEPNGRQGFVQNLWRKF